jgi:hypothetical protein
MNWCTDRSRENNKAMGNGNASRKTMNPTLKGNVARHRAISGLT